VTANYLLWLLIKPSQWILLSAVLSAICWRWRLGRRLGLATVALTVLFGLLPTGGLLLTPLEDRFDLPPVAGEVSGVIVLAGSERATFSDLYDEPQLNSAGDRLTTFLLLAGRHPQARLVHSGNPRESRIARSLLLGAGVAPGRLSFENGSRNTCDSARLTQQLIGPRPQERWLLVSSAFHMPRAVACFRAVGWEIVPYPTDFRRGPEPLSFELGANLEQLDLAAHEWVGLLYYRLRGRTNELFPAPRPL
jgi:uncharacterized SAM-binding protein YcdF (DUF218 family)